MVQLRPAPRLTQVSKRLVSASSPRSLAPEGVEAAGFGLAAVEEWLGACCLDAVEVEVFEQLSGSSPERLMAAKMAICDTPMPPSAAFARPF